MKKMNKDFIYEKLTLEEQEKRQILGRLVGVIADSKNPTRNGRRYSLKLWENVFNNPIMQEKIKNRCCFGELNHPADRTDIDMEKIAVCLAEVPQLNEKGQLCGLFDILNTPNGRILKTLCDYGCNIGISSRGQGDLITGADGNEEVDPDTYECECFDVVVVPAVESARLKYVTESFDGKASKTLKGALRESLASASTEDRKIMKETLDNLNIDVDEISAEDYHANAQAYVNKIENEFTREDAIAAFKDYNFGEHAPEDEEEKMIFDALKAKIELNEGKEADAGEVEEVIEEQPEEAAAEEVETEEVKTEVEEEPAADKPAESELEVEETAEEDVVEEPQETPAEESPAEEHVEEKSEEEIFLDYLKKNFDAEQVEEVCKTLNIDIEKISAEEVEEKPEAAESEEESVEETESEEAKEEVISETEPEESEIAEPLEEKQECTSESCADKKESKEGADVTESVIDNEDEAFVKTLQEALKHKSELEESVRDLQEKLAVSDTKVSELLEENDRSKKAIARLACLTKASKDLKENVTTLEESLKEKDAIIESQKERIARLVKGRKESVTESFSLNESVKAKEAEVSSLNESLSKVNAEIDTLKSEIASKDGSIKELNENLTKTTSLKEAYKKLANEAVNKYINIRANTLGLTDKDIKRKLGESYTLQDVDQVCEDLKSYQLNVSKLPFSIDRTVGVRVNENRSSLMGHKKAQPEFDDDSVDESLIKLANLR